MGKHDEDDDAATLFGGSLDKATVLQEARAFNESPINPRRCRAILAKVVYLLHIGGSYQTLEATDTFFSISKLFQNPDVSLRQMVYLAIKELAGSAENVFFLTSSVTKDMNARADLIYRPNSIRALGKIIDASMVQGVERFFKQSIVDKNPAASSAALVTSIHLFHMNREVVRRWANEAQEAINGRGVISQYHALGLLYLMRQHDRMAIIKLVQNYAKGSLRSPHAIVMLIRYAWKIMEEEDPAASRPLYDHLESWLRHKSDMVVFEAARAICNLRNVSPKELFPAVSALQLMLVSHKPTLRFAAIRTLNKLAMTHPAAVFPCNLDMENLIADSNRSIATFAITTLLKTGNEASVDRLMKQISGFMSEISDEFKIIVVEAVRSLCLKFPSKQTLMVNFLSGGLRDDGGYEFKRAIVEAIFDIIYAIPESKEFALSHLCEFIEDCEFARLAVRILHVLGTVGPQSPSPTKYIRYIYNRVILENSVVRAAAVSALAQFAVHLDDARERIKVLLERCTDDMDDEVRDRAAMYLLMLKNQDLSSKYVANDATFALATLETKLEQYLKNASAYAQPFDILSVPVISKVEEMDERQRLKAVAFEQTANGPHSGVANGADGGSGTGVSTASSVHASAAATAAGAHGGGIGNTGGAAGSAIVPGASYEAQSMYAKTMSRIPQLAALGSLFRSSAPVQLTESETEYIVTCIKHVFPDHLVFQFDVKNTLNDSVLENVRVSMVMQASDDAEAAGLVYEGMIPAERLVYDMPGSIYVAYRRAQHVTPIVTFTNKLQYVIKDCDPTTGEPDDEGFDGDYNIDAVDTVVGDYMVPTYVKDFGKAWSDLGDACEMIETYALTAVSTVHAAVTTVMSLLGMSASEDSGQVKEKASTHVLLLTGTFVGGVPVAARIRLAADGGSGGVAMEFGVRSRDVRVSKRVVEVLG